ncbi:hypothetical protein M917_1370 [Psychrobacter aquaticus CMS 56]|uniref:Uncharacterized protein n=1 Tax=Psychrobacter aquaticus CMS 56 TaxID=1354303 RepID=U4TAY1_9GAMM|nr:hypothetical protein M917_1370 [Psychrobacter aquaticus CMS 56]
MLNDQLLITKRISDESLKFSDDKIPKRSKPLNGFNSENDSQK